MSKFANLNFIKHIIFFLNKYSFLLSLLGSILVKRESIKGFSFKISKFVFSKLALFDFFPNNKFLKLFLIISLFSPSDSIYSIRKSNILVIDIINLS